MKTIANALTKFYTFWNGLSERTQDFIEFILDVGSAGAVYWLLFHLNSPWWGYVLALVCCTIQKAIVKK